MDMVLEIEGQMGRSRDAGGYRDRVIDLDLLLFEDTVMDHPRLISSASQNEPAKVCVVATCRDCSRNATPRLRPDHFRIIGAVSGSVAGYAFLINTPSQKI